jgi:RimJ/RimL family protein N-acetyltransferase
MSQTGSYSRRSRGLRLGVPVRRSPVYTITMCPIIPTHQMLSIAPNLLTTQRLILRPWRETDRAAFARLNADPAVMEFMPRRLSRDESDAMAARVQAAIEQRGWGFWAVEMRGAEVAGPGASFIGFVGLSVPSFTSHFMPCVEIGWRLAREHWGNGYASEAAAACLRFGFEKLTLQQIVAFTVPLNKRSISVMERAGMSRNPADDFEHPNIPPGDPLRPHVLYRINRAAWENRPRATGSPGIAITRVRNV